MVVMVGGKGVWAQDTPACAAKLVLCYDYLNNSKPPDSCCNPFREAVQNELQCLCNLYSSPDLYKSFRINLTQALELPKHCGINSTLDRCNTKGATVLKFPKDPYPREREREREREMGPFCKGYDVGVWVMTVAMVVMVGGNGVWAEDAPACAAKLVPCSTYLNVSKPPESCCSPLREAVQNELPCLCNLYSSPDLFKSFGINLTQALELPEHCGINSTIDRCNTKGATAPPGTPTPVVV
ncbi:non-specific lipid transfer protein GPI-anchored 7-like [Magnolia sinica]|uniref:non-specific lipid transfer protein GPI-anchored 7-like n=1 Tax=Magnolia sinica TaxID=86752 RepID=UPI0026590E86|nr:non-specific lipid transfer protein GPI-anchored 7-like [Magnolia sinica]